MTGTSPGNSGRLATRGPKIARRRSGPFRLISVYFQVVFQLTLDDLRGCPLNMCVRSNLAAATVAVVGAGTIAFGPALPGAVDRVPDLPPLIAAQVVLTADSNPLTDFLDALPPDIQISLQQFGARLGPALFELAGTLIPASLITDVTGGIVGGVSALIFNAAGQVLGYTGTTIRDLIFGSESIPAVAIRAVLAIPYKIGLALGQLGQDPIEAFRQLGAAFSSPATAVDTRVREANESVQAFAGATFTDALNGLPDAIFGAVGTAITKNSVSMSDALLKFIATLFPDLDIPAAASVRASAVATPIAAVPRPAAARHSVAAASVVPAVSSADAADPVKAPEPSVVVGDRAEPSAPVTARSRSAVSKAARTDAAQPKSVPRSRAGVRHAEKTAPASDASDASDGSDGSDATPAG